MNGPYEVSVFLGNPRLSVIEKEFHCMVDFSKDKTIEGVIEEIKDRIKENNLQQFSLISINIPIR